MPVAIMTSPANHTETISFFKAHHNFGLSSEQLSFFCQKELPYLTMEGNFFLNERGEIVKGPNGNGDAFALLVQSGIFAQWERQGVSYVNLLPIDNPLADPFDAELFGFHERAGNEITIKAVKRRSGNEKVGLVALVEGEVQIVEYMEIPESLREDSRFEIANAGLYLFSMSFIKRASTHPLPLHAVKKPVEGGKWGFKFEHFIFDTFCLSEKSAVLLYPRENCFAPLKNFEGEDSMQTAREALIKYNRTVFETISGKEIARDKVFELAPEFYYPTPDLKKRWAGKDLPNELYIEAGI